MNGLIPFCLLASLLSTGLAQTSPIDRGQTGTARHHHHKAQTTAIDTRSNITTSGAGQPLETQAQRSADKRLLRLQQAQSAHNATVNNQIVQQANDARAKVQKEVRIQDAPGPSQTGVVPAAGAPRAPTDAGDRIQDAPGPAQTLPSLPSTSPTNPSVPTGISEAPVPLSQTDTNPAGSAQPEAPVPEGTRPAVPQ